MPLRLPRFPRLALLMLMALLAACARPETHSGFDLAAFSTVPATQIEGRLRLPPGSDLNGPAYLLLIEGDGETAQTEQFELDQQGSAYVTASGSIALQYRLKPSDHSRYDRARQNLAARMSTEEITAISVRYRMCRPGWPAG